jgi:hypothetical protein
MCGFTLLTKGKVGKKFSENHGWLCVLLVEWCMPHCLCNFSLSRLRAPSFPIQAPFFLNDCTQAEDKLAIVFGLYDDQASGYISIETVQTILKCMHLVLGRMVASTNEIPANKDDFMTLILEQIHAVASVGGRPVKEVTLDQLIQASRRFPKFYAYMDSMQEEDAKTRP